MSALALNDLPVAKDLDLAAMNAIIGRGEWHQTYVSISTGAWSNYQNFYKAYVGQTFHDGYLSRQYSEGWQRTRTQTEYSYWDHFVRV